MMVSMGLHDVKVSSTHIEHHQTPLSHHDLMVGSRFVLRHHATKTVFLALLHKGKSGLKCNPNFEACCVSHRFFGYPILWLSQALMKTLLSVWDRMLHIWVSARPGLSLFAFLLLLLRPTNRMVPVAPCVVMTSLLPA